MKTLKSTLVLLASLLLSGAAFATLPPDHCNILTIAIGPSSWSISSNNIAVKNGTCNLSKQDGLDVLTCTADKSKTWGINVTFPAYDTANSNYGATFTVKQRSCGDPSWDAKPVVTSNSDQNISYTPYKTNPDSLAFFIQKHAPSTPEDQGTVAITASINQLANK